MPVRVLLWKAVRKGVRGCSHLALEDGLLKEIHFVRGRISLLNGVGLE